MDTSKYRDHTYGRLVRDPLTGWPHHFFRPEPIPRHPELSAATHNAVSRATAAMGKLSGLGELVNDPVLLLGPAMQIEALSSSRIEGTQASISDVLNADAEEIALDADLQEVYNYLHASQIGAELLNSLPITGRFITQLHETLMSGVRGDGKYPGEFRSSPVWIGAPDATPATATFIPPHNVELNDHLSDWEKFANTPSDIPPVIRAALLHYQFETIHPFLDGNGRIGRLLIGFAFMQYKTIDWPILHISGYFEKNREEYYERLQAVRERGEMNQWIQFFAAAVETQANLSSNRIKMLVRIQNNYREQVKTSRSNIHNLINIIMESPVITVKKVRTTLEVSQPTASTLLRDAQSRGWLESVGRYGRGGEERWIAREVLEAVTTGYMESP